MAFPVLRRYATVMSLCTAALLVACGGGEKPKEAEHEGGKSAAAETGGPLTPAPGGSVVVVQMVTAGDGNYFEPKEVHVKKGDVVRFTLKVGVHNVHFLADSNKAVSGYPDDPSDMLQLPGQTWDVAVHMAPGSYYFQCDPHALLGMHGHIIVE